MRMKLVISGISLLLAACQVPSGGPQSAASGPRAGASDLAGVVTSANGPEGGKGTQSKVLKFQLRPDPLAN